MNRSLGIIAEPLINLKTIFKFLLEHRQKCLPINISRQPKNGIPATKSRIDKYIGISKLCCPLCSIVMRTIPELFIVEDNHQKHLEGFADVHEAWKQLSEEDLKRPGVEGEAGPSKNGKLLAR
ncbi:uncharacterized protein CLUP02_12167 [Colletotrichum lupini]|uniref:Uncharacterized protein n=1 Tax=Colletotrichum lupini TaxID=145971 RepID=A0A9Q8T0R8_9PEZI|nr:uncharacterized protein CLUP02_12167 [Colletotrichum lupini]UQC86665.1 hypothetical protein CLUP02_12167 [Colletotrichum lupini]